MMQMRAIRVPLWLRLLALALLVAPAAAGICANVPAAISTPPPCTPPFNIPDPATPKAAFDLLVAGNGRFSSRAATRPNQCPWGITQTPYAAILSCADARVPPEILFDTGVNELFIVRVAGNTAGAPTISKVTDSIMTQSLAYSVQVLGAKVIVVLGHLSCGAVNGSLPPCDAGQGAGGPMLQNLCPAVAATRSITDLSKRQAATVTQNVILTVRLISGMAPFRGEIRKRKLAVVGGVYDIASGKVTFVTPLP
jgi:carbonic anhydrase